MVKTTLTAYLGISTHYTEPSLEHLYALIDELCSLSGCLKLPMYDYGTPNATIKLLFPGSGHHREVADWWDMNLPSKPEVISIRAEISLPVKPLVLESPSGETKEAKGADALALHRFGARTRFIKRIWDIIMIANVAHVGILDPIKSAVFQDGDSVGDIGGHIETTALWHACDVASRIGWPELHLIEFAEAWEWAISHQGFLDGFGDTPVDRALNAFTQVLNPDTAFRPMQLFWALMGIEALYAKGSTGIMQQVKEKSQVLLGPQESFKKRIAQMYDFRSRLIHGDSVFPGYPVVFDADKRLKKHDDRLYESIGLAIAILVATLQEIIQRGWSGLHFSYKANEALD